MKVFLTGKQFKKAKRVRRRCPVRFCWEKKRNLQLVKHLHDKHPEIVLTDKFKDVTLNKSRVEDFTLVQLENDLFIVIIYFSTNDRTLTLIIMQMNVVQSPLDCFLIILGEKFQQLNKMVPIHPYNYQYVVKEFSGIQKFPFLESKIYPLTLNLSLTKIDEKIVCRLILNNAKNYVARQHLNEFKCPVCLQIAKKPIYICQGGHNFCHSCYSQLKIQQSRCPICKKGFTNIRNRSIENFLTEASSNCYNEDKGCSYYGLVEDLIDHEEYCKKHRE